MKPFWLLAIILLATAAATDRPSGPIGRYQIIQARWHTETSNGIGDQIHEAPIKIDTITGDTWRFHSVYDSGDQRMFEGWLSMTELRELRGETNMLPNPHPRNSDSRK